MINLELLKKYGAFEKKLKKQELLFQEGDEAIFYYQIVSGSIKMNNYSEEGQETIQGIFKKGESFGEPAILGGFSFPTNAETLEKTQLICLEKNKFLQLLKNNPEISLDLLATLSNRLRFKAILSKEIKAHQSKHQIMTLLNYLKKESSLEGKYQVEISRQTIANLTGLRVETVIRAIKKLNDEKELEIIGRKIFV